MTPHRLLRLLPLAALVGGSAALMLVVRHATVGATSSLAANCYGDLNATTYPTGFHNSDFSTTTTVTVGTGAIQPLVGSGFDANTISLPFDQHVHAKFVEEGTSHNGTLGWFFFDQVQPFLDGAGHLADVDNDGVADFFQAQKATAPARPLAGLWKISTTSPFGWAGGVNVPDLVNPNAAFSDGGTYGVIPNLLEGYMAGNGGLIWKLWDDDADTTYGTTVCYGGPCWNINALAVDLNGSTNNGYIDYDVNGDGFTGTNFERDTDLGLIPGNREIVLFVEDIGQTVLYANGYGLSLDPGLAPQLDVINPPIAGGFVDATNDTLRFEAYSNNTTPQDKYMRWWFSNVNQNLSSGDCISYSYYIEQGCLPNAGGIDFTIENGTKASTHGWTGNTGDLSAACQTWHRRQIPVPAGLVGHQARNWEITIENDTPSTLYRIHIDRVRVEFGGCGSGSFTTIYSTGAPPLDSLDAQFGFSQSVLYDSWNTPFFTKQMLNPDFGMNPGTVLQRLAIGCEDINSGCYGSKTDGSGNVATHGWMDATGITRLNDPFFNNIDMNAATGVQNMVVGSDHSAPHFATYRPPTDQSRIVFGFDRGSAYDDAVDHDYNDFVFVLEAQGGGGGNGQVVSNLISGGIPSGVLSITRISKVRLRFTASYPSPACDGVAANINFYYSVDNKVTWRQISFPAKATSGDQVVDVFANGDVGNQLFWRADFSSPSSSCGPILQTVNVGYEAVEHGEFKFGAPIPLANMVYSGTLESPLFAVSEPAVTANDFSFRGHLRATRLFDPLNPAVTAIAPEWDGGAQVSLASAGTRAVYTSVGGSALAFTTANSATLYPILLPTASRALLDAGQLVYDLTGDSVSDNNDARMILEWTRGWEYPAGVTFTPAKTTTQRAWLLGAIHSSSPAVAGPPPRPTWLDGAAAPSAMVSANNTFRAAQQNRATVAIVGSQDGMVHAFDAGAFRQSGNTSTCNAVLTRGCFGGATDLARYGTGNELWAYIPPSQLGSLRNNHPKARAHIDATPTAEIDGSVAVEDIYDSGAATFRTVAFVALGRNQPYVTAINVGGATPAPQWASDFTDVDFHGAELSPAVGLAQLGAGRFIATLTSGLSASATDLYFFVLDAFDGSTVRKVHLNTGANAGQALGFAGYPSLVDGNQDGLVDRIYGVDTSGRIWKHDLTTNTTCVVASAGETVYSSLSTLSLIQSGQPVVKLFVGGGPNPDGSGTPVSPYHLHMFVDDDPAGFCTNNGALVGYTATLPSGYKLWAAPQVNDDTAFFATASAPSESICATGAGALYTLSVSGDGLGAPLGGLGTPLGLTGSPVSSIRVYDGHAVVNTVDGKTTVVGGAAWNNTPVNAAGNVGAMHIITWQEL